MLEFCDCVYCEMCGGSGAIAIGEGPDMYFEKCPDCDNGRLQTCAACSAEQHAEEFEQ